MQALILASPCAVPLVMVDGGGLGRHATSPTCIPSMRWRCARSLRRVVGAVVCTRVRCRRGRELRLQHICAACMGCAS